jgi:hypothetical protein
MVNTSVAWMSVLKVWVMQRFSGLRNKGQCVCQGGEALGGLRKQGRQDSRDDKNRRINSANVARVALRCCCMSVSEFGHSQYLLNTVAKVSVTNTAVLC